MYKNIAKQEKLLLKDLVAYQDGQVVSKTLVQNDLVSVTIFSFDKGEEISTHASGGDAMVTVLEGTGRFTVGGQVFVLQSGETLVMPKDVPPRRLRPGALQDGAGGVLLTRTLYGIKPPRLSFRGAPPRALASRHGLARNNKRLEQH